MFSLWICPPKLDEKLQNFLRDRPRKTEEVDIPLGIYNWLVRTASFAFIFCPTQCQQGNLDGLKRLER